MLRLFAAAAIVACASGANLRRSELDVFRDSIADIMSGT